MASAGPPEVFQNIVITQVSGDMLGKVAVLSCSEILGAGTCSRASRGRGLTQGFLPSCPVSARPSEQQG